MRQYRLSKSKILSGQQCPKRLYLEVHRPELVELDESREMAFATGHAVGEAARQQFPGGVLIGHQNELASALKETTEHLSRPGPITLFEATFQAEGVLVRCDVLQKSKTDQLSLIEIKSSTEPKSEYDLDVAIQSWVIERAGYRLNEIKLGYINRDFVYRGNGDYAGLFKYKDMRKTVHSLFPAIPGIINKLKHVLAGEVPSIAIGKQCFDPYECPFVHHCWPKADYPVINLPRLGDKVYELLAEGFTDLREVPPERIQTDVQKWVQRVTCSGKPELKSGAQAALKKLGYPRHYLDFETVQFAVPIWADTRPYEALPFQFSCHVEQEDGTLTHKEFLYDDGTPPMRAFAESVIEVVEDLGPVFVYSHYEKRIVNALAERFPELKKSLLTIVGRFVDLLPITKENYYHPAMQGSWSIKAVLPTIAPEMDYGDLGEIQDGGAASAAYLELTAEETAVERRQALRHGLLKYCERDTLAMIEVVCFLQQDKARKRES